LWKNQKPILLLKEILSVQIPAKLITCGRTSGQAPTLVKTNDLQLHHLAWLCRESSAKSNPSIWIQFLGAHWQISLGAHRENLPHTQDLTIELHNQKSDNPNPNRKQRSRKKVCDPHFFFPVL
jgi:hypothetical protein